MHKIPTTLLHSLEGMRDLDWEKLLKLQCQNGSFLFSPSSTAFAFMQTRDNNCLKYLRNAVKRFNGGGCLLVTTCNNIYIYILSTSIHVYMVTYNIYIFICLILIFSSQRFSCGSFRTHMDRG